MFSTEISSLRDLILLCIPFQPKWRRYATYHVCEYSIYSVCIAGYLLLFDLHLIRLYIQSFVRPSYSNGHKIHDDKRKSRSDDISVENIKEREGQSRSDGI